MAYTTADLAAVRSAIAKGEHSVQFADRSVTYRSIEDLLKAEDRITRALADSTTTRRRKHTYAVSSKGL